MSIILVEVVMNFGKTSGELNSDQAKVIIDSILNASTKAGVVIDKHTFEIMYENDEAIELLGDKLGANCYEVFCTKDIPCFDCPMSILKNTPIIKTRWDELLDRNAKWQYTAIKWFDNKDAVLATLVDVADSATVIEAKSEVPSTVIGDRRSLDTLTRIYNYSRFYADVQHVIMSNEDKNYAIVVFDIDRFKSINDIHGMLEGDEVLKQIGVILTDMFGREANYARMHSDMFAFCISYNKKLDIIKVIEKIRKKINSYTAEKPYSVGTSYGIYLVEDRMVPVNLMCDRAMMAARTIKGDIMKFCAFYDEQYRRDMLKTNEIERDMNPALEGGQFLMYLQPKYNISDSTLCGAEVLCRWLHPEKGLIPPNDFIPLFEKNGFILKLDEYMWECACKSIRKWLDEGRTPVPLSVNISRYHIKHNNVEKVLMDLLRKYNLTPSVLNLEITESLFLDNPEELNRVLARLQSLGFKLEVDDFGSGFSSLNLIRNITVDTIKIDKDFLDNEIATEKGQIVVRHTISMAKELKLQVIAEGVETEEHLDFLKKSECDIAQGYFFAKPMPIEEFEKFSF